MIVRDTEGAGDALSDPMNMDGQELIRLQKFLNSERSVNHQNGLTRKEMRNLFVDLRGCEELRGQQVLAVDDYPEYILKALVTHLMIATRKKLRCLPYKNGGVSEFGNQVLDNLKQNPTSIVLMDEELWSPEEKRVIHGSEVAAYCLEQNPDLPPIIGFSTVDNGIKTFFGKWAVRKDLCHPQEIVHKLAELLEHIRRKS